MQQLNQGAQAPTVTAIDARRARIDIIDGAIRRLIARRAAWSADVQRLKAEAGAGRIDPEREREVVEAYRREWGEAGAELAARLLELCRGAAEAPEEPA